MSWHVPDIQLLLVTFAPDLCKVMYGRKGLGFGVETYFQIPALPLSSCVVLASHSVMPFLFFKMELVPVFGGFGKS